MKSRGTLGALTRSLGSTSAISSLQPRLEHKSLPLTPTFQESNTSNPLVAFQVLLFGLILEFYQLCILHGIGFVTATSGTRQRCLIMRQKVDSRNHAHGPHPSSIQSDAENILVGSFTLEDRLPLHEADPRLQLRAGELVPAPGAYLPPSPTQHGYVVAAH